MPLLLVLFSLYGATIETLNSLFIGNGVGGAEHHAFSPTLLLAAKPPVLLDIFKYLDKIAICAVTVELEDER